MTENKPVPTADIVTSADANTRHQAAIEQWGDRIHAAGGRLCRYFKSQKLYDGECPPAAAED